MAIIEEASEYNVKQYQQATPIPAKFLQMNGEVTNLLGRTESEVNLKYNLFAWKMDIMNTTIGYTENENVEVGDVLMLPETAGTGKITDSSQLKKGFEVTRIVNGTIYVSNGTSELHFSSDSENDYIEDIEEILPMPTGLQNGLVVAPRGTVYKAIEIKVVQ